MCRHPGCEEPTRSVEQCRTHHRDWLRQHGHRRCGWQDCEVIIARPDGHPTKIDGRTAGTGKTKKSHCRWHEVEHLRPTPEIREINRHRLGTGLVAVGDCWKPRPEFSVFSNGAGAFFPEGSNGKISWPMHRAVWDLLMGGHAQRQELDHLSGCSEEPSCCNPAHLQPVYRRINVERGTARRAARKAGKPYSPKTCGPATNRKVLSSEAVRVFAQDYELPMPA